MLRQLITVARSSRAAVACERGFTALEMIIVTFIMGIAITTLLASLDGATKSQSFVQKRNEALDNLRVMAATFSKDARQGIEASTITSSTFTFDTYLDGAVHEVSWRAVDDGDDDRFERVIDGSIIQVFVVDLTETAVFSYFGEPVASDVGRVRLSLYTQPDERYPSVGLTTETEMRNVD